jgi:hypothetical protein
MFCELTVIAASVGLIPADTTVSFDGTIDCESQTGFPSVIRSAAGTALPGVYRRPQSAVAATTIRRVSTVVKPATRGGATPTAGSNAPTLCHGWHHVGGVLFLTGAARAGDVGKEARRIFRQGGGHPGSAQGASKSRLDLLLDPCYTREHATKERGHDPVRVSIRCCGSASPLGANSADAHLPCSKDPLRGEVISSPLLKRGRPFLRITFCDLRPEFDAPASSWV